ncbi:MAG TPA: hypothetical protein VK619_07935 [Pyrinomonadaceae bacterium]|nr:hypothetical protein [Pyrinomonadaceae bacterium]
MQEEKDPKSAVNASDSIESKDPKSDATSADTLSDVEESEKTSGTSGGETGTGSNAPSPDGQFDEPGRRDDAGPM